MSETSMPCLFRPGSYFLPPRLLVLSGTLPGHQGGLPDSLSLHISHSIFQKIPPDRPTGSLPLSAWLTSCPPPSPTPPHTPLASEGSLHCRPTLYSLLSLSSQSELFKCNTPLTPLTYSTARSKLCHLHSGAAWATPVVQHELPFWNFPHPSPPFRP